MSNPYQVLGVSNSATKDEIKKAYKRLCSKHHPDKYLDMKDKEKHQKKFKEIQQAYSAIKDQRNTEIQIHPFMRMRNPFHTDFDKMFDDMEKKMSEFNLNNDNGTYYSKQTFSCTRNGKTVTKVEENINGDIKQFESYESRPMMRNPF